ncbi:aminoglycoside phosphotransferase [Microbacterium sp. C5A9]|uniref:hypothetical protein n=1 Tax=Microbacterium sp. C5A9 TaxID=2736663 RepID=UPI001F51C7D0|nr:hypothetical protein [Microbacterium sp. C5A9]MCI1019304.1 aminoglycoside phosphotransferase [Microbacterium sp. C5A9]
MRTSSVEQRVTLRADLRRAHERALAELGLDAVGRVQIGRRERSIGSAVRRGGSCWWLRVVRARREWARGPWWTGNQEAAALAGVAAPRMLEVRGWEDGAVVYRAEVSSMLPGRPCAPRAVIDRPPAVDEEWWNGLRSHLTRLADAPTERRALDPEVVRRRLAVFFGIDVRLDTAALLPAHGELHWRTVHRDPFGIADWEAWGLAPRGYDAAFLLGHSLAVPTIADEITHRFRDDLETDAGVVSQLFVMTKLLTRADGGEHGTLVPLIHRHVDRLLGARPSGLFRDV